MIAVVLWTPLGGRLGISPAKDQSADQLVSPPASLPEPAQPFVGIDLDGVVADISDNDIRGFDMGIRGRQSRLRTKGNKIES